MYHPRHLAFGSGPWINLHIRIAGELSKYLDAWTLPKSIKLEPLGVQSGHWDSIFKAPSQLRRTTFSRRSRRNGHYFPWDPQYLKPPLPPGCSLSISHHVPSCYTIENILWSTRGKMWQHLLTLRTLSLLSIKHKETFGRVHKRQRVRMLTVALAVTARSWKQSKRPWTWERMNHVWWYIHPTEHHIAVKRSESEIHTPTLEQSDLTMFLNFEAPVTNSLGT